MIVLFFGDIVGRPGLELLLGRLPELREIYRADAVIANGENVTNGVGIKPEAAERLLRGGVDVITAGNHVFKYREIYPYLDREPRIIRPFNLLPSSPGRGLTAVDTPAGRLGVVNLLGSLYMNPARSPFEAIEQALDQLQGVRAVIVDLHGEATSEKVAMGHHLAGRVSALIGTHTHVRTADARILAGGTAYISDVGMCGSRDSVIGVKKENVLERFLTQMPVRFDVATEDVWLEAVVLELDGDGRARRIESLEVSEQRA